MIVLDTNVVSELVKGLRAEPSVLRWVRNLSEQPVTTVVNKAELLAGIALLPAGARRTNLVHAVESALVDMEICLPFTPDVPAVYAEIVATRTAAGRPIGTGDAFIAAIARAHGAAIATRDVSGFSGIEIRVIDPWSAEG